MRKLAALIFCLLCAQGTVIAQQKQPFIIGAAVNAVSGELYVSGQEFGTTPAVAIDNMPVHVVFASPEMLVADELPKSVLANPGTYLLTVTSGQGANRTAAFVIAIGAIGPEGPKGDVGPAGEKGDKGDPGPVGAAGAKGDKGDKGDTGVAGAAGAKGDKGDKGDTGAAGAAGAKGDKGDTGAAGAAGTKG